MNFDPPQFDFAVDLDLDLSAFSMAEEDDDNNAKDTELMRSLPELIKELKKLRVRMESDKKLYDRLLNCSKEKKTSTKKQSEQVDLGSQPNSPVQPDIRGRADSSYGYAPTVDHTRQRNLSTASCASLYCLESNCGDTSYQNSSSPSYRCPQNSQQQAATNAFYQPPRKFSVENRFDQQHKSYNSRLSTKMRQDVQSLPRPRVIPPTVVRSADYFVHWMSGECGISLRNFSSDKRGAQIAVLQQAQGVTTGISNSRLGDQLICVNDENVETLTFKEIVRKLKSMPRPISLGFRSNPSLRTSPTHKKERQRRDFAELADHRTIHTPNPNVAHILPRQQHNEQNYDGPTPVRKRSSGSSTGPTPLDSPSNGFALPADEVIANLMLSQMDIARQSAACSDRSSTPTLSDDVEVWCKEQEEMHSECIMLITETVMRCEKLQQEDMDQLQNRMHFTSIPSLDEVLESNSCCRSDSPGMAPFSTAPKTKSKKTDVPPLRPPKENRAKHAASNPKLIKLR